MAEERFAWVIVANPATGWEAELMVARLRAEEIPARARGNDLVGLFGPFYQGHTTNGFLVEVPSPLVDEAREVLAYEELDGEDLEGDELSGAGEGEDVEDEWEEDEGGDAPPWKPGDGDGWRAGSGHDSGPDGGA